MIIPIDLERFSPPAGLPELVAAAVAGQQGAWVSLIERFAPLISSVTRRYRLPPSDAGDVQQTVWLRLVEHIGDLREPRALPGWIATTTRNETQRVLSARRRVHPIDPQVRSRLDRPSRGDLDENLVRLETQAAVQAGLNDLRPEHRDLLILLFADPELSYRQISQKLGIPTGSIGPTRARSLQKLHATTPIRRLAS